MFIPLHDGNPLRHIRLQFVTLAIIAINILVWLVMAVSGAGESTGIQAAFYSYGFIPAVANGYETLPPDLSVLPDEATYVSYAFVHGGFMHLAGNMLFLWVFGDNVEDAMGHVRFLIFYLACAVAGALFHSWVLPESESPLVGASGAAAGVVAAYVMLHPRVKVWILALGRIPLRISAFWAIGAWIAFQVVNLLVAADDEVSWGAHVGGILAGAALLPLIKRRGVRLFDDEVVTVIPAEAADEPPIEEKVEEVEEEIRGEQQAEPPADGDTGNGPWGETQPPKSHTPWGRQPR